MEPVLELALQSGLGGWIVELFLVDSGAERSVLSASLLARLDSPRQPSLNQLAGFGGGTTECLTVTTKLRMRTDEGNPVIINGPFEGIAQGREGELSILGRDVLGNFAVILDRPKDVVSLLHGRHHYTIQEA